MSGNFSAYLRWILRGVLIAFLILSPAGHALAGVDRDTRVGKIAFVRDGNIWIMNDDGSGQIQLTRDGKSASPSWSPDGSKLAFSSGRDGYGATLSGYDRSYRQIYLMNADGSNQVKITHSPDKDFGGPSFSPDGKTLVLTGTPGSTYERSQSAEYGRQELLLHDLMTKETRELTSYDQVAFWENDLYRQPFFSPDGETVFYGNYGEGVSDMMAVSVAGGEECFVQFDDMPETKGTFQFMTIGKSGTVAGIVGGYGRPNKLFLRSTGKPTRYVDQLPVGNQLAFSPDERRIAIGSEYASNDRDEDTGIWLINSDGSNPHKIADNASQPAWQPLPVLPVLLVHGFANKSEVWGSWVSDLTLVEADKGNKYQLYKARNNSIIEDRWAPVYVLDYGEQNKGHVPDVAKAIPEAMGKVKEDSGADKVVLVGHSMGGLLGREYLENLLVQKYRGDVAGFITLDSPHNGAAKINTIEKITGRVAGGLGVVGQFGPWLLKKYFGPAAQDMKPESRVMADLNDKPLPKTPEKYSFVVGTYYPYFGDGLLSSWEQIPFMNKIENLHSLDDYQIAFVGAVHSDFTKRYGKMWMSGAEEAGTSGGATPVIDHKDTKKYVAKRYSEIVDGEALK